MDKLDKALLFKLRAFREDVLEHLRSLDKYTENETVNILELRKAVMQMDECEDLLDIWENENDY